MSKKTSLRLGFDVTLDKGSTWKPLHVKFWNQEAHDKNFTPSEPFKYMADALVGLSLVKLNHYLKSPVAFPQMDYSFACEAFRALDPHIELYDRSQPRVRALQTQTPMTSPALCAEFEELFNGQFDMAIKPWGVDLTALGPLLDTFLWLENRMGGPLLYNFSLNFSKPFVDKLHSFYTFLYHLRSLVAVDHNAHVEDPSHEGVTVDAITDYMPRAEYVVNDALLYWNFKKLSQAFNGPHAKDTLFEKNFAQPFEKIFEKYSHNACNLIENLPKSFVKSMNSVELEEALYLVQMDWLLGSPAGLLFKIREEVFALQSGYEKIFWKDIEPGYKPKPVSLSICCELDEGHISDQSAA